MVRINGEREKAPGHAVKPGDVLTIGLDRTVRILKVIGFSERRGDCLRGARALWLICRLRRIYRISRICRSRRFETPPGVTISI